VSILPAKKRFLSLKLKIFLILTLISVITILSANFIWLNYHPPGLYSPGTIATYDILIVLALTSLISLVISWVFIRPVKSIIEGIGYLKDGHFNFKINVKTDDEFEDVAELLNSLSENLSEKLSQKEQNTHSLNVQKNILALCLDNAVDSIIATDLNHNIVVFNLKAEEVTGYKTHEVIGKPINQVIEFFDHNQRLQLIDYFPAFNTNQFEFKKLGLNLRSKKQGFFGENKNADLFAHPPTLMDQTNAPKDTYVDLKSILVKGAQGRPMGYILNLHDVSQDKQLDIMKVDFVSMAAHELRTPLTSIRGYLQVFMEENEKSFNDDQKMLLGRIKISSQQLTALVENLLMVSRIERGAVTITAKPLNWVNFIKQIMNDFVLRAADKKIDLRFVEPQAQIPPMVQADDLRINEVLNNLIANAINYTQSGGAIRVWVEQKGNEIITHVTDNGQGLTQEALSHLFTKFYRASGKLEMSSVKGNGLGLYITKEIVEMHHGRIWVNSEGLGKGSTFSFSLPVAIQNAHLSQSNSINLTNP
jgi:two-component system, OmpR family, sensor histidine kinase VicK